MKYKDIRGQLKTGDVLLFSGTGLISSLVQWWTGSKWSHVALVVKSEDIDAVFCFESTTISSVLDITTGSKARGVQLTPLSSRIKSVKGEVYIKRLEKELFPEQKKAFFKLMINFRGRGYESDKMQLLRGGANTKEDLSTIFCSELVAATLKGCGLLDESRASNSYYPKAFAGPLQLIDNSLLALQSIE